MFHIIIRYSTKICAATDACVYIMRKSDIHSIMYIHSHSTAQHNIRTQIMMIHSKLVQTAYKQTTW